MVGKFKISVIMPVFNTSKFLQDSLYSVLSQTLHDIEIICIDDGSTDDSLDILKRNAANDSRIVVLQQENSGSGVARNKGLSVAQGEYIAFLDSDDCYPSEHTLEHMYEAAVKNNALICGGSLNRLNGDVRETDPSKFDSEYTFTKNGFINFKDYQFDYGYWRFLYKNSFLRENEILFPNYLRQQDPPFFIKAMTLAGKFYALKEATYLYRVSHKQIKWTERKVIDMFKSIYESLDICEKNHLDKLYYSLVSHINSWTFQSGTAAVIGSSQVRKQVLLVLDKIDLSEIMKRDKSFHFADIYQAINKARNNNVLVSVIVPVYNVEKYLRRCLDSVLAQTMPAFEVLCVNDGSTDDSLNILEEYTSKDARIKVLTKVNGGLSSARNYGMERANGDYILFVDSDDWIDSTTIEKALAHMICNVDIISWGAEVVNEGLDLYNQGVCRARSYHEIKVTGEKGITYDVIRNTTRTAWNKLFKKSIIQNFDLKFTEGRLFEDNDFLVKYFVHCRHGYFLDEYLYHYIQRPNSIMERVRNRKSHRTIDHLYIFDSIYRHFVKYGIANQWKGLLTASYQSHLGQAYKYAPVDDQPDVRKLASKMASEYDVSYFNNKCVEDVRLGKYYKVWELNEFIVSLTSYPKRIHTAYQTIWSILHQNTRADNVILWLAKEQFPNGLDDLPLELVKLQGEGLTIRWCEDLKSYKKLIPVLREFPLAVIITADDDVIYDKSWLGGLIRAFTQDPMVVHCYRAHKLAVDWKGIAPYKTWKKSIFVSSGRSSYLYFFTGVGGVLYPPGALSERVMNKNLFSTLCPWGDDIWFWGNVVLNGYRIHVIPSKKVYAEVYGTQEVGLWHENVDGQRNDLQIAAFANQYPEILRILRIEQQNDAFFTSLERDVQNMHRKVKSTQNDYKRVLFDFNAMQHSVSFRIGRKITWAPRKIRNAGRCFKQHGTIYTMKRVIEHFGIDMGTGDFKK